MATRDHQQFEIIGRELLGGGWPARLFGLVLGALAWQLLAMWFPQELMPFPLETIDLVWDLVASGVIWTHLGATMWRILWGFLGSMVLGTAVGVLMGTSDYRRSFFTLYVLVGLSIPAIAWAVIALLIFGFSELTPITATIATTFPFITVNVWKGVEDIDWNLVRMSKSFDISRRRMLTRMILPNTADSLMTAIRYGLAISWKIVTIAEVFASKGVGLKIVNSYNAYQFEQAWAWALVFMLVILFIEYGVFRQIEKRIFGYRQDVDLTMVG